MFLKSSFFLIAPSHDPIILPVTSVEECLRRVAEEHLSSLLILLLGKPFRPFFQEYY